MVRPEGISFSNRRSIMVPSAATGTQTGSPRQPAENEVIESGMILPFEQLSLTFSNISYYVSLPKV